MEQHELLLFIVGILEKLKIPYFITGALASIAYGEPRFTNDIDIVVDMSSTQIDALIHIFPKMNFILTWTP